MPKKFTFLILTLMCVPTLLGSANAFAANAGEDEEPMRYWTVEQLMELNDELESEKELRCAGDLVCEREFYQELRMSDSAENNVLDMFNNFRIIVSKINPSAESVHVLYHDTDAMMREWGETDRQILNEFHLVWLDSYMPDPIRDFSYINNGHPIFVDEIHENNLSDGVHLLMIKSITKDGQDWISPNQEVEFITNSDVLSSNTTNKLYYAALIGTWQTHNVFDYGECLASPDYRPGMECQYVFYEDFTRGYLPFAKSDTAPIDEPAIEEPIADEPTTDEPVAVEPVIDEPVAATTPEISTRIIGVPEPISEVRTIIATAFTPASISASNPASVPEATSNDVSKSFSADDNIEVPVLQEEKKEFPWWIIVFAFSGIALVPWWLIPSRKRDND